MSISGLTFNPPEVSRYMANTRDLRSLHRSAVPSVCNVFLRDNVVFLSHMRRKYLRISICRDLSRRTRLMKSRVSAAFGDAADDSTGIFPRINVKDPYQRLGISREASEEEIQAARKYLINMYGSHQPSVDAIESAHDKIIMQSFYNRKNPKIDIKKKVNAVTQSRVVKAIASRFQTPATNFVIKTGAVFVVLGVLTVLFPTEEGPTLQVAISLIASIYFLYARLKSKMRAFLYGVAAFFGSWLLGTLLMVSVVPPILKGPRSLEVTTSLLSYVTLWIASTYLK